MTNHLVENDSPDTSFPRIEDVLEDDLNLCLINSDSQECNQNLSTYIKTVVDIIGSKSDATYHELSVYAMRLLTLNLFVKNYQMCLGKFLGLIKVFTDVKAFENESDECKTTETDEKMKEFICIVLYLLLKVNNGEEYDEDFKDLLNNIEKPQLYHHLKSLNFITLIANFIVSHIDGEDNCFILIKFCGDIIFQYLFYVELLSDEEFENIVSHTNLIHLLVRNLLNNHETSNQSDDWADEDNLIAYEEFKLLLLINEQYLMKSYTCSTRNKVFDELMTEDLSESSESIKSKISGFMNLLLFHLNREESQIIKILILKFLYLVFTSSYTSKLYYLNDLKILVDIFVRELNDLPFLEEVHKSNRPLVLTYLKVMYPMMMFSQLNDLNESYKKDEIVEMLSNFTILQSDSDKNLNTISDLANKCLTIPWLKKKKKVYNHNNSSASSLSSTPLTTPSSTPQQLHASIYEKPNDSNDSIAHSFTRVASTRTFSNNDYHLHTTVHNTNPINELSDLTIDPSKLERRKSNILDLPNEYLQRRTPKNQLAQKAMKKKAPPPPPSPINFGSQTSSPASSPIISRMSTPGRAPPPPPPPRRRKVNMHSK